MTGERNAAKYRVDVPVDCVLLLEAYTLSVNGAAAHMNGSVQAFRGPASVQADILDGEWVLRLPSLAQVDYCKRVTHVKARGNPTPYLSPLPEWTACNTPFTPPPTGSCGRQVDPGGQALVRSGCYVSGDISVGGRRLYDDDGLTAMVTQVIADTTVSFPHGGSVFDPQQLQAFLDDLSKAGRVLQGGGVLRLP